MTERTKVRKGLSIILGLALAIGGAYWFYYMLVHVVEPVKIFFWLMPTTLLAIGLLILWDDFKNK